MAAFDLSDGVGVFDRAVGDCHGEKGRGIVEEGIASTLYFERSCGCCEAQPGADVSCSSWCGDESMAILALKDGRFVLARESSDSTGHG